MIMTELSHCWYTANYQILPNNQCSALLPDVASPHLVSKSHVPQFGDGNCVAEVQRPVTCSQSSVPPPRKLQHVLLGPVSRLTQRAWNPAVSDWCPEPAWPANPTLRNSLPLLLQVLTETHPLNGARPKTKGPAPALLNLLPRDAATARGQGARPSHVLCSSSSPSCFRLQAGPGAGRS
jgi:hypothetical protein